MFFVNYTKGCPMKKALKIGYFLFYVLLGVAVIVTREITVHYLPFLVGGSMILYGTEEILTAFKHRKMFSEEADVFNGQLQCVIGIFMMISLRGEAHFVTVCIIWSVWSILRENKELREICLKVRKLNPFLLNLVESLIAIVFSVMLILNPGEHHAVLHTIVLGTEYITKVVFPEFDKWIDSLREKSKKKKLKETESVEETATTETTEN